MLTEIENTLPTADNLQELENQSVIDCLTFVCQFTWHYFTSLGSSLRLRSANSLMMQLFQLDVCHEFDVATAGQLRSAWEQGLMVACIMDDTEARQYIQQMMMMVVASVSDDGEVGQVYRLSEIISRLWHITCFRPVDLDVVKQALSSSTSVLLKSPWLLASVLDHSLFLRSLDGFELAAAADTTVSAVAAFTARFLLTSWKTIQPSCTEHTAGTDTAAAAADDGDDDYNGDKEEEEEEVVAAASNDKTNTWDELNSLCIEMLMDIAVTVVYIRASQAYIGQELCAQQELQQDFCNLIGRLSSAEAECLIGRVMERSLTNGEVWSLVLDVVLHELELSSEAGNQRWLTTDAEQFMPLTLSSASTLCVILPRTSRDARQDVAEITVAMLLTCDDDRIAAFDSTFIFFVIFYTVNNNNFERKWQIVLN